MGKYWNLSKEIKQKMRERNNGKNNPMWGKHHSKDWSLKMSKRMKGKNNPNYGKHLSKDIKRKISKALIGKCVTEKTKRRISRATSGKNNAMWGKHLSRMRKNKISQKLKEGFSKGRKVWNKDKKMSEEFKKNCSLAHIGMQTGNNHPMWNKHLSIETKKKMRESRLKYILKQYIDGEIIHPTIGKFEKSILDNLEKCFNYPIKRQHLIDGYFLDGYCPALNLAIEIDEKYHNKLNVKKHDKEKEKYIIDKLNCKFIRIPVK